MIVDKLLEKYFKSKEGQEYLKTDSESIINNYLVKSMRLKEQKNVVVFSKSLNQKDLSAIKVNRDNFYVAFAPSIWQNLKLETKAQVVYWAYNAEIKNIEKKYKKTLSPPSFFLASKIAKDVNLAHFDNGTNSIYFSPDFLEKGNGFDMLNAVAHECKHYEDVQVYEKLRLPAAMQKFLGSNYTQNKLKDNFNFLNINLSIILEAAKTSKVNFNLAKNIIETKNKIHHLSISKCFAVKNRVKTREDFESYLETMLYYNSPIEKDARAEGINRIKETVDLIRDNYPMVEVSDERVTKYEAYENVIDKNYNELFWNNEVEAMSLMDNAIMFSSLKHYNHSLIGYDDRYKQDSALWKEKVDGLYTNFTKQNGTGLTK